MSWPRQRLLILEAAESSWPWAKQSSEVSAKVSIKLRFIVKVGRSLTLLM